MKKYISIIISLALVSFLSSCFECETCHRVKFYDDAPTGKFDIPEKKEVCSRLERKTLLKDEFEASDEGGNFKSFWVCDILEKEEDNK